MIAEQFIRNSDNQIRLILTENSIAITGNWISVDIYFGGITLHRDVDGDGISLDPLTGLLTITPADLTSAEKLEIDGLTASSSHRVQIVIHSVLNDDGAVFGGRGSDGIFFFISDKPS
jgi:hypothetical protein